jgi:adhesin transport system membrane fusion protein
MANPIIVSSQSKIIPLSAAGMVLLTLWAGLSEIDQVSRANGQVIPQSGIQTIQSNEGGIIKSLAVGEGDFVRQGQPLVVLDQVKIAAAVMDAKAKVAALKAQKSRIEAELFGRPLRFSDDVKAFPEFVANEQQLYARRRTAQTQDIAALYRMLGLVRQELSMNQSLLQYGDVSRAEILRLERSAADLEAQIASRQNKYLADLQTEYTDSDQQLEAAEQLLTQRTASLQEAVLRAPVEGIVKNVRLKTVGGVLRPGDDIMEIVPTREKLLVEAKVSPRDIAYIHVGQTADVKFDAYDASIYGSATGKVTYVSPDTIVERREVGGPSDLVFYRVRISVDTSAMRPRVGEKIVIQPGMLTTTEIKTGRNTVLNFIFKPITKTLSNAFGER